MHSWDRIFKKGGLGMLYGVLTGFPRGIFRNLGNRTSQGRPNFLLCNLYSLQPSHKYLSEPPPKPSLLWSPGQRERRESRVWSTVCSIVSNSVLIINQKLHEAEITIKCGVHNSIYLPIQLISDLSKLIES